MTDSESHQDGSPDTAPVPTGPSEDGRSAGSSAPSSDECDDAETDVAPDGGDPGVIPANRPKGTLKGACTGDASSASAQVGPGAIAADESLDLSRSALAAHMAESEESVEEGELTDEAPVDMEALRRTVEALLFAAEGSLTVREIARAAGSRSNVIRKVLKALKESLDTEGRPWELMEVGGGWRYATRPAYYPAIQKLKVQRSQRRLTPAAMEVLALIAYSQEPIGRAEIEAVRGVDSGPVLRLLLDRKLVRIAGRGQGLGQPLLYAVTQEFLEHFGIKSTKELPQSGELRR